MACSAGSIRRSCPTTPTRCDWSLKTRAATKWSSIRCSACAGELKLGNFQFSFVDLTIPVSGIDITVTRTYDSLHADQQGEFGYGWTMDYRDARLQVSLPESDMEDYGLYTPYRDSTRVYVTLPGGRREGFTFVPTYRGIFDLMVFEPRFVADRGVTSRLTVKNVKLNRINGEYFTFGFGGGQPWNPAAEEFGGGYTLTTKDGTEYQIDGTTGQLHTVTDRNDNRLTFSDTGVREFNRQDDRLRA